MTEPKCVILTDSTSDLPAEWYEENNVVMVAMSYFLDGTEYKDDAWKSITPESFYSRMSAGEDVSTSQTSMVDIQAGVDKALEAGLPVVYLGFSSALSSTAERQIQVVEATREARPDVEIHLVDTLLAAVAQGWLVVKAVEMRDNGATAKEIADWVSEALYSVNGSLTLDELEHLRKGGRIPDAVAGAGAKLDIKPLLKFNPEGNLAFDKVARGRKKSLKALVDRFKSRRIAPANGETELIIITDAAAPEDADKLEELIRKEAPDAQIMRTTVGPVIGSHVGPGMVAVVFWGKDRRSKGKIDEAARKGHTKIDETALKSHTKVEKAAKKAERMVEKAERKAIKEAEKKSEKIMRDLEKYAKGGAH